MTEQLKLIINGLNKELKTNYDLIKFDSLNEAQHLQILIDLLAHFDAGEKFDINEEDQDSIPIKLLNMIRNVKYKPDAGADVSAFRKKLITGDRGTVFAILQWLLKNTEQVKKTAYLAKYLIRPDIPTDMLGNADVADLMEVHDKLVGEFKEAHKMSQNLEQNSSAEIINDIKQMALERDIVMKRLESAQINMSDVNNKEHLLGVAKGLRVEQERSKKLMNQVNEQREKLKRVSEFLQRSLNSLRGQNSTLKTPGDLIQKLSEELKLNEYLVKEKMPLELSNVRRDAELLQSVQNYGHIQRENLLQIQDQIDEVNREVESLVQKKLALSDPHDDKLAPFRHQAALIKRNKESVAEKLEELQNHLRDLEMRLSEKQAQVYISDIGRFLQLFGVNFKINPKVKQLLGDTVLRGDELKKYVSKLRGKSVIYKKQRATLSSIKAEAGVLTRTIEVLQSKDSTLEMALLNNKKMNINLDSFDFENKSGDSLTKQSPQELTHLINQLSSKINEVKREMAPLVNRLKPLKEEHQQLQQQHDQKKRVFDSTSIHIASQMEPLEKEVAELQSTIDAKEDEWRILRQRIEKAEQMLEIIDQENATRNSGATTPRQSSRLETLQMQILQQERQAAVLREEQKFVSERQSMLGEQSTMWSQLLELLECKLECMEEASSKQGSVTITKQSQTLTL